MKGILVIIDGLGDLPSFQIKDKTPLEIADKPNLDYMARYGQMGYMYPINEITAPESDTAVVSILGNNPLLSARGVFEAIGAGLRFERGDLALRTNFATIDKLDGKILDRRAGRTLTNREAQVLGKEINKIFLPRKFIFQPTIQHRGVLVLRGGFSDNITNTDPSYHSRGKFSYREEFKFSRPLDEDENSQYSANMVNEIVENSFKVLNEHRINLERRKKGLFPANIILTRDAGISIPRLKQLKNWMAVQYMPLEIGICKTSGMRVFSFPYPDLKDYDVYQNLHNALKEAVKFSIKSVEKNAKKFDYCYIHIKETDIPGHDNKPNEKKNMIEFLDKKLFSFLKDFAEEKGIKIAVTGDHSTPCKLKSHSSDPVPVLLFDGFKKIVNPESTSFTEKQSKTGKLGKMFGKDFLKKIGFN